MKETSPTVSVLLTNDDGIYADGLWAMYHAMADSGHRVHVVAPDRECTGVGHAITFNMPITVKKVRVNSGYEGWAVAGTPADCIKLAIAELLNEPPDIVVTGVNPGANVGINMNYSGTVAAAREAALRGLRAVAVSVQRSDRPRFEQAARFTARMIAQIQSRPLASGTFLNINVPDLSEEAIVGVRLGSQGHSYYADTFEKRRDPRDQIYYWYGHESEQAHPDTAADDALLRAGYITVTPVRCDMTDYDHLMQMRTWGIESID